MLGYQHVQLAKLDKALFPACHLICQTDSYSSIIYFFSGIGPLQVTQVSDELPVPILTR